jgi:hypothetical protein
MMELLKTYISHDQRKKIFKLAKLAGIKSEELHCYLPGWAGTSSLSSEKCTSHQAHVIIEALEKACRLKGIVLNAPLLRGGEREAGVGCLTAKQFAALSAIQSDLGWNDHRIIGFAHHTIGRFINSVDDLTPSEASKVITGLKRMGYTKHRKEA